MGCHEMFHLDADISILCLNTTWLCIKDVYAFIANPDISSSNSNCGIGRCVLYAVY